MSATCRTLQRMRFAVKPFVPSSFPFGRARMAYTSSPAVRASSSFATGTTTTTTSYTYPYQRSTTPPLQQQQKQVQQQQQQQQESSYDYNNDGHYVSEFQDLFDQMEQDPRSSTLGVDEGYLQQRDEKRLECGVAESALRFKTTHYGGRLLKAPYVHPNEHRVVMCVNVQDLGLNSEMEQLILQEIVGKERLHSKKIKKTNGQRQELRLTSNQFGSRIENKRHLVSMLNRIVMSCRRLASEVVDANEQQQQQSAGEGCDDDNKDDNGNDKADQA